MDTTHTLRRRYSRSICKRTIFNLARTMSTTFQISIELTYHFPNLAILLLIKHMPWHLRKHSKIALSKWGGSIITDRYVKVKNR